MVEVQSRGVGSRLHLERGDGVGNPVAQRLVLLNVCDQPFCDAVGQLHSVLGESTHYRWLLDSSKWLCKA